MSDNVLKWFFHWANKTEQWRCHYKEPKYTRVFMIPNEVLTRSHFAYPLMGVFAYKQMSGRGAIIRLEILKQAADMGERLLVFVVNPETKDIKVMEGQAVMEKIPAERFQENSETVVVELEEVPKGDIPTFFKAINSWKGNWYWRRENPVHLWKEVEPK
jgi:hypothetical protein